MNKKYKIIVLVTVVIVFSIILLAILSKPQIEETVEKLNLKGVNQDNLYWDGEYNIFFPSQNSIIRLNIRTDEYEQIATNYNVNYPIILNSGLAAISNDDEHIYLEKTDGTKPIIITNYRESMMNDIIYSFIGAVNTSNNRVVLSTENGNFYMKYNDDSFKEMPGMKFITISDVNSNNNQIALGIFDTFLIKDPTRADSEIVIPIGEKVKLGINDIFCLGETILFTSNINGDNYIYQTSDFSKNLLNLNTKSIVDCKIIDSNLLILEDREVVIYDVSVSNSPKEMNRLYLQDNARLIRKSDNKFLVIGFEYVEMYEIKDGNVNLLARSLFRR